MRGPAAGLLAGLALCVTLAACSGEPEPEAARPHTPLTIAFAGDVHFAGVLADRLDDPSTAMGPLTSVLAAADIGILNLETAITTRGAPQAKQFTFRAPPVVFDALKVAGVDVVTMANNHALDYGPNSVPDALAAAQTAGMPVVGLGADDQQAFTPWVTTVRGERVAVIGATAVVDDSLVRTWSAGPGQPGVATAIDGQNQRLVDAVRAARATADTVVVELHYGKDLTTCPTAVQRQLVDDLVAAGRRHRRRPARARAARRRVPRGRLRPLRHGQLPVLRVERRDEDRDRRPRPHRGRTDGERREVASGADRRRAAHPADRGRRGHRDHARWEGLRGCAGLSAEPTPQAG